jgi:hypothetical protein
MKIEVTYIGDISAHVDWTYQAIDTDTYDAAPDQKPCPAGYGKTESEAIRDLLDQIEEQAS